MKHSDEFLALCQAIQENVEEVSIEDLKTKIETDAVDYLIDVRDADEFQAGAIEDAHHLSKGWIEAKIHELVENKDAHIVLYCGGGNRSLLAADNLKKMGYRHVFSLIGGYKAWVADKS